MTKLISLSTRLLRPRDLRSQVDYPILRKVRMPLLRHNQPRYAFTLTTFKSTEPGDDISTHFLYEPLEEVERLENYRPGGYHPIRIGDHFHCRYRVVHKLGHGSYSNTWLARDGQSNKYVALKVCIANSNLKEGDIISALFPVNTLGKNMVPSILDRFAIQGPNGKHAYYVAAMARASL